MINKVERRNLQDSINDEFKNRETQDDNMLELVNIFMKYWSRDYYAASKRVLEEFHNESITDYNTAKAYIEKANKAFVTNFWVERWYEEIVKTIPHKQIAFFEKKQLPKSKQEQLICAFIDRAKNWFSSTLTPDQDIHITFPTNNLFQMVLHARTIIEFLDRKNNPDKHRKDWFRRGIESFKDFVFGLLSPQWSTAFTQTTQYSHQLEETLKHSPL